MSLMAAVAVVAFMAGTLEYTKTRGKLLLTALLVGGYFLTTLGADAIPRAGIGRHLHPVALTVALSALILLLVGLWGGIDSDEFWKAVACATALSLGFVFTGVFLARVSENKLTNIFARTSAALSSLLTLMTVLAIALEVGAAPYWWAFTLLLMCWLASTAVLAAARFRLRWKAGR